MIPILPTGPIALDSSAAGAHAMLKKLALRTMTGTEALGRPFEYTLDLLSEDGDLNVSELLGEPLTVRLELGPIAYRFWNGIVTSACLIGSLGSFVRYRVTMRPWLWLLNHTSNCRIFQRETVPTIVKEVFRAHGLTDFQEVLSGSYAEREFVVQYGETDFNFVTRLLEEEGIYYFFRHEDGKHTLMLADSQSSHDVHEGYESLPYYPPDDRRAKDIEYVDRWELNHQVVSEAYATTDFDFERPSAHLGSRTALPGEHALRGSEHFDYAGAYLHPKKSDEQVKAERNEVPRDVYVRIRLEELRASLEQTRGTTNARGLGVGNLLNLTEFPRADQNREYLIVSANYELRAHELESTGHGDTEEVFRCSFAALSSARPFRPSRRAAKPVIHGPQTAIVVGRAGEEIWTDEYGRVKVQFHWDRFGTSNEDSSCWVRVAQLWAGDGWGAIHIPRIGQEVIVEFLQGDPDRPLITGRLYNSDHMPPYALPVHQTQSGIKSRSTRRGTASNFNEVRFDDAKGHEELHIHAEKDQSTKVKAAQSISVGAGRSVSVGGDESISVGGKRTTTVTKKNTVTVNDEHEFTAKLKVTETFKDDHSLTITGAQDIKIEKKKTEHVTQSYELTTDEKFNLTQGETTLTFEGNAVTLDAKGPVTVKRGPATVTIDDAGKVSISTSSGISFECGSSSIKIGPGGVEIIAAKVAIKADPSSLELSASAAKLSGPTTNVEATAVCGVKGGTMLNLNSG